MMRRRHKKQYRAKKNGGIFRSKIFWFCFLALVFLGTGIDIVFFSSVFQVGNIKIEGNRKVSLEDIKNIISKNTDKKFGFVETKSIFLAELNKISDEILKDMPQIAKVNLIRDFPNTISAQVVERIPVAVFCQLDKCFLIDNTGVVFEETSEIPGDMPKITKVDFSGEINPVRKVAEFSNGVKLREAVITGEQTTDILKIALQVKNFGLSAAEFSIKSDARIDIRTSEGWEIFINPQKDIDSQLKNLGIILKEKLPTERRKNLQYIDLRFERIYIYPEGL